MPHITVDDEQAKILSESPEGIEIRDKHGRRLGYVFPNADAEDIAIARERLASDEPRYTTEEVLEHIRSLEQK